MDSLQTGWQVLYFQTVKRIVSRDRVWIQWILTVRSEECRVAGEYFYSALMPFSCFNLKNVCFGCFSLDSYSAHDM
jgi:hypothetical protein